MKYANSFEYTFTIPKANIGTEYSGWFDVDFANELYCYVTIAFSETQDGDEDVLMSIVRNTPDWVAESAIEQEVVAFTQRTASQAEEEKYASALTYVTDVSADNQLGTRVQFKCVTTGTGWHTGQILTVTCTIYAKRN